ncbi:hypothetical protein BDZ45DRAFT_675906, partial [Acephala macrosclerotiorum]
MILLGLGPIHELIALNKTKSGAWLPEPAGIEVIGFIVNSGELRKGFMISIRFVESQGSMPHSGNDDRQDMIKGGIRTV